jgi:hypothetical protein
VVSPQRAPRRLHPTSGGGELRTSIDAGTVGVTHVSVPTVWNIEPQQIPYVTPPTHAMQMFRYAEEGSIRFSGWPISIRRSDCRNRPGQPGTAPARRRGQHDVGRSCRRSGWSQIHVRRIAEVGRDYGAKLKRQPRWEVRRLGALRQRALRQMRWANAHLKITSPQIIAS